MCGPIWIWQTMEKLLAHAKKVGGSIIVFARVSTFGASQELARKTHRERFTVFRRRARRAGWVLLGMRHLEQGDCGRWHAHNHLLVCAPPTEDRASVQLAIVQAWEATGPRANAWFHPDPVESIGRPLRYAVNGAIDPPDNGAAEWSRALRGARLIIAPRLARDPEKRSTRTTTHLSPTNPIDRIRAHLLATLAGGPQSKSTLRRGLYSADRPHLADVLTALEQAGEAMQVRGERGYRWTLCSTVPK